MDSRYSTPANTQNDIGLSSKERRLAGLPDPDISQESLWFDAVLRPHRSLNRRGYLILFGIVALISLLAVIRFIFLGAWPVAVVFFLDALLLWGGFKLSYATARAFEAVQLMENALIVTKVSWRGQVQSWVFTPHWVRIEINDADKDEDSHATSICLQEGRKKVAIGAFLSPMERLDMGHALKQALRDKKAGHPPYRTAQ